MTIIKRPLWVWGLALLGLCAVPAHAWQVEADSIALTLDEAEQIAIVNNYMLRMVQLDVETAQSQVRSGWGQLVPQIDFSSGYTRTVEAINPFAGSAAGGLFQSLGYVDWLAYNEEARTDTDPTTTPTDFGDFVDRREQGLSDAGIVTAGSDNPFLVPNAYSSAISIRQIIFDGRAIKGARGASMYLEPFQAEGAARQTQLVLAQVHEAYYGALLAQNRVTVLRASTDRTLATEREVRRRVEAGIVPVFEQLTIEVERANLETQLLGAENSAASALDNLKLVLGIPIQTELRLVDVLEMPRASEAPEPFEAAVRTALDRRPDVEQARVGILLEETNLDATRALRFPTISAIGNFSYIGNVPENRVFAQGVEGDPFTFTRQENDYFSDAYWGANITVGFSLQWNLFDGFQRAQQIAQRKIAVERAQIQAEQLQQQVRFEVDAALRTLRTASRQVATQRQNLRRAEVNYEHARRRFDEGVISAFEERQANDLFDQSKLGYLQSVHDYLLAQSAYLTATGTSATGR